MPGRYEIKHPRLTICSHLTRVLTLPLLLLCQVNEVLAEYAPLYGRRYYRFLVADIHNHGTSIRTRCSQGEHIDPDAQCILSLPSLIMRHQRSGWSPLPRECVGVCVVWHWWAMLCWRLRSLCTWGSWLRILQPTCCSGEHAESCASAHMSNVLC